MFIVKLFNLLFFVSFATGYIHSGEIKIFKIVGSENQWDSSSTRFLGKSFCQITYRLRKFTCMIVYIPAVYLYCDADAAAAAATLRART